MAVIQLVPMDWVILPAVGYDADGGIFPLAWAVVSGENYRSWTWFLLQMRLAYPGISTVSLAILSDRQKGLIKAITKRLPLATHYYCIQHIGVEAGNVPGRAVRTKRI